MNKSKIELMCPVGNFEALQATIDNGADSVYFGVEQLNMRSVSSVNFSIKDLAEINKRCSEKNIKTYITLNTIIYDHDLQLVKLIIDEAVKNNISAVICSDNAVMSYAKQKGLSIHISTQQNITNIESVKFYSLFSETMVLSRELTLTQIKEICNTIKSENIKSPNNELIKIEIFGHGALCMAVSGKCYLSLHTHNSSANRGACRQNCRKSYYVTDEDGNELKIENEYIMSPKDLCTIHILDQVIEAGVTVLKIEGRGRASDYVATTTKCYREAIDSYYDNTYNKEKIQHWMEQLSKVYNRGFWEGYYLGQQLGEWTKDTPGSKATRKKIYVGKGEKYYPELKVAQIKLTAYDLKEGDQMLITGNTTGVKEFVLTKFKVDNKDRNFAKKGEQITFPLDFKIRAEDKLYKLVSTKIED